jgi:hypothetical protein
MTRRSIVVTIFVLVLAAVALAADDPITGTWRETSQWILTAVPDGISFQENQNKPEVAHFGKDSQFSDGSTVNLVRNDNHTFTTAETITGTGDRKLIFKETVTTSPDGKQLTRIQELPMSQGRTSVLYQRVGSVPAGDAFFGSWRLISPLGTIAIKIDGGTITFTENGGRTFTAKMDGEPANGPMPRISVRVKRIDAKTIEITRQFNAPQFTSQAFTTRYQAEGDILTATDLSGGRVSNYERVRSEASGPKDYVSVLGSPDEQGIYTVRQPGATDLYFRKGGARYSWSPDRQNWMPTNTITVSGGTFDGRSPAPANVEIINGLEVLSGGTVTSSKASPPLLAARTGFNPFVGTWKLNAAKSQAGTFPKWKAGLVKVEAEADGQKCVADYDYEQASSLHTEYTAQYDGKDYPAAGSSYFDTVSIKRLDANTLEFLWKKDGKETARWQWMMSGDGNASIVTMKTIYQGSVFNQLMVLERQ